MKWFADDIPSLQSRLVYYEKTTSDLMIFIHSVNQKVMVKVIITKLLQFPLQIFYDLTTLIAGQLPKLFIIQLTFSSQGSQMTSTWSTKTNKHTFEHLIYFCIYFFYIGLDQIIHIRNGMMQYNMIIT